MKKLIKIVYFLIYTQKIFSERMVSIFMPLFFFKSMQIYIAFALYIQKFES